MTHRRGTSFWCGGVHLELRGVKYVGVQLPFPSLRGCAWEQKPRSVDCLLLTVCVIGISVRCPGLRDQGTITHGGREGG